MPSILISMTVDGHEEQFETQSSSPKEHARKLSNYFKAMGAGIKPTTFEQFTDDTASVKASGTLTCATVVADNTCVIAGVTLTAKASPSGESQFLRSADNTVQAAAIAAAINAHSSLQGIVTATSSGAVVTISAALPGPLGNLVTLVGTATTLEASAATLTSGAGVSEVAVSYSFGR